MTDNQVDLRDDATLQGVVTTSTGTTAFDGDLLKWNIPSLSNENTPVTMTYTYKVNDDAWGVHLRNVATAPGNLGCPEGAPLCNETNHDTPHYTLAKTAVESDGVNDGFVKPGDTITYTLTVHNDSDAPVTGAVVTDNLANVLLYADPEPADAAWTDLLSGSLLTWAVPTIAVDGDDATLSYTVKVKDTAYNVHIENLATPGPGGDCPVDCDTDHFTPHYTLVKSAVESDGVNDGNVLPGDTITYTLTVHNDSQAPVTDAVITDDLTDVLDNADPEPLDAAWTSNLSGNTLTWQVPTIAVGGADATFTYTVKVNDGAWDVVMDNVATPGPGGNCPTLAQCTTHHETPPVSPFVVKKIDDDTGEALAGAHFVLWQDNGTIGGEPQPGIDVSMGERITGPDGRATWADLLDGPYLIQETVAPPVTASRPTGPTRSPSAAAKGLATGPPSRRSSGTRRSATWRSWPSSSSRRTRTATGCCQTGSPTSAAGFGTSSRSRRPERRCSATSRSPTTCPGSTRTTPRRP